MQRERFGIYHSRYVQKSIEEQDLEVFQMHSIRSPGYSWAHLRLLVQDHPTKR